MISLVSSVVIESGDSIVLDLGQDTETEPPTPRSQDSASSLLSKVIKVGAGVVMTAPHHPPPLKCKTPTLKRKKSMTSTDTLLTSLTDDDSAPTPSR